MAIAIPLASPLCTSLPETKCRRPVGTARQTCFAVVLDQLGLTDGGGTVCDGLAVGRDGTLSRPRPTEVKSRIA
jgi:hypothetical protein